MLRGVFPRLFGHFKEGQIVRGQFTYDATANTYTATAESFNAGNGLKLSVARTADGKATVSFPACRHAEVLACRVDNATPGTVADVRIVEVEPMTASVAKAGSFKIAQYGSSDGLSYALDEMADGATLTIVMYLGQ